MRQANGPASTQLRSSTRSPSSGLPSGLAFPAGCPDGRGTGGPGYTIPAEFNATKHEAGVLSMARTSDPNSATAQFFINVKNNSFLDRANAKDKVGYEINFNRYFHKYTPPRPLEEIDLDLKKTEEEILRLFRELTA